MTDLYQILGVTKNVSQGTIKAAYRTLAQRYHPDKMTGDEAKFMEVQRAYDILGDPKKRDYYDRTGSTEVPNDNAAQEHLAQMFGIMVDNGVEMGNLIQQARDTIAEAKNELQRRINNYGNKRSQYERLAGRVTTKEGPNLYLEAVEARIEQTSARIKSCVEERDLMDSVAALLDDYEDTDPKIIPQPGDFLRERATQTGGGLFGNTNPFNFNYRGG